MKAIAPLQNDSVELMQANVQRARKKPGFALERYFYQSSLVYQYELDRLFFKSWIYAGHISEIPKSGDFVLFDIGEESLIIVRDKKDDIHALINVCRHRGSRVCEHSSGNTKTFVCPYHNWTYNSDGTLRSARHMDMLEGFDKADYSLNRAQVSIFHGLIFVNFDLDATDPQGPFSGIEDQIGGYQLSNAKIAHKQTYAVNANWKLCLENYLECYHCATAHPAYARIHTFQDIDENVAEQVEAMQARASKVTGIPGIAKDYRKIYLEAESLGACASAHRYGLYKGYVTGSQDGKPVAPLMGKFQGYDGGAGDFQIGPFTFMLNYPDYGVLYRFIPRELNRSEMEIVWFVNGNAKAGGDYDVDKVTDLWHKTTMEDDYIITRNSAGVNSRFYTPGPYHPEFEKTTMQFIEWYLVGLAKSAER